MTPEERSLKRCLPCPCGGHAIWGSGFLGCTHCNFETGYDNGHGSAVREWNQHCREKACIQCPDDDNN